MVCNEPSYEYEALLTDDSLDNSLIAIAGIKFVFYLKESLS